MRNAPPSGAKGQKKKQKNMENENTNNPSEMLPDVQKVEALEKVAGSGWENPVAEIKFLSSLEPGQTFAGIFEGFKEYDFNNTGTPQKYAVFKGVDLNLYLSSAYKFLKIPEVYIGRLALIRFNGYQNLKNGRRLADYTILFRSDV